MGIRFLCPSCRNKVHVKDRLAGLRGFCPTCGAKVEIPFQSTLPGKSRSAGEADRRRDPNGAPSAALESAASGEVSISAILPRVGRLVAVHTNPPADPLAGTSGAVWYVVPPDGTEPFGPADSATLNQWLQQGRVVSRSLVWRQDWPEWRKAGTVWPQLALSDVDPRLEENAERVRGKSALTAGPQFNSPRMPSSPPHGVSPQQPAGMHLGGGAMSQANLLSQMHAAAMPGTPSAHPMTAAAVPQRSPLTAVPAGHSPSPPGTGPHADGLYYPQRSTRLYWLIVGVLLVGLVGMSVALFYVLDQMKQHKQRSQPTEKLLPPSDAATDESAGEGSANNKTPSGRPPSSPRP